MSTTLTESPVLVEQEQRLVLGAVSWEQYESLLRIFPDHGGLRITYIDGRLTLLSPKRRHDWHEEALGDLVKAIASGFGIDWEPAGHTTYRREDLHGGVEGDQTFYLGVNAETMRGPVEVDLSRQPPPDLAIEVELTHRADDSIAVWGRLGVPEVWRFDVDRGTLNMGIRQEDGRYSAVTRSPAFPELAPEDILSQLRIAKELGASRWYAQLGDWVRDVLLPRRGVS